MLLPYVTSVLCHLASQYVVGNRSVVLLCIIGKATGSSCAGTFRGSTSVDICLQRTIPSRLCNLVEARVAAWGCTLPLFGGCTTAVDWVVEVDGICRGSLAVVGSIGGSCDVSPLDVEGWNLGLFGGHAVCDCSVEVDGYYWVTFKIVGGGSFVEGGWWIIPLVVVADALCLLYFLVVWKWRYFVLGILHV